MLCKPEFGFKKKVVDRCTLKLVRHYSVIFGYNLTKSKQSEKETMKKSSMTRLLSLIKEISIIFALYFSGEFLVSLLGIHFPGSIVGMLLLLLALHLKWLKLEDIRTVSTFLLGYMPLFFIPAGVSVMGSYGLMDGYYAVIIVSILFSTFLVMALTALTVQYLRQRKRP